MRILVLGVGAVGGYFGGRLAQKGVDVTFLVREKRRQQLEASGLVIKSVHGDATITPQLLVSGDPSEPFDLIMLSTKAYHLEEAMASALPYIGDKTLILPLLNGVAHMEQLVSRYGTQRVLGGLCFIESTLNEAGEVVQTSKRHEVTFGEWQGENSSRLALMAELFSNANATFTLSKDIVPEMWHKYLFITTLSGITTLMNSCVGPIRDAIYGKDLTLQLAEESVAVIRALGAPIAENIVEKQMSIFWKQPDTTKSSMLRDMEKGLSVEADHLQGYLLEAAKRLGVSTPLLQIAYTNLKVYENKRLALS
ncbi:ketopantoate reductase family protein [Brevibacillus ginsengisoli]|uniref:ketopantoate reductase family protein n=1 Tax=Brevibacillus ginsengisoli TaxID=363854 RepID=UPI003CE87190